MGRGRLGSVDEYGLDMGSATVAAGVLLARLDSDCGFCSNGAVDVDEKRDSLSWWVCSLEEEKVGESRTTENLPKPLRVEEEWRARTVVMGWPGEDELEGWLFLLEPPPSRLEAKAKKPTLVRGDLGEESVEDEIELSVDDVNWCWRKDLLLLVAGLLAALGLVIALLLVVLLLVVLLLLLLLRSMAAESASLLLPEEARDAVLLCDDGGAVLAGPWSSASWTSCSFGCFLGLAAVFVV